MALGVYRLMRIMVSSRPYVDGIPSAEVLSLGGVILIRPLLCVMPVTESAHHHHAHQFNNFSLAGW